VSAFLHPLQEAAGVLGACKITGSGEFRSPRIGHEYHWSLCDGDGVAVRNAAGASGVRRFYAGMSWRVIEDARDGFGPYRVTTRRYEYSLTIDHDELWAFHWHPDGKSDVTYPHMHLGLPLLAESAPISNKAHPPTGRMTLEQAIRWVIDSGGKPRFEDWADRLALAEAPHLLYRTWTQSEALEKAEE
jgi:hypothetical protein